MLERLLDYALHNKMAAFLFALVLAALGQNAFHSLTIEAFPDPTDTQVQVITLFPGQASEEVERRVSLPLERALNGTPGLLRLRSISLFALSFVTLTFADGTDPYRARQLVAERLADASLPDGVRPSMAPLYTPIGEVYRYTLDSQDADPMTLRTLQDWTVRPQLLRVPGVADVVSYGGLVKEIHVQPDPVRMGSLHVDLGDIFAALKKASDNATGGYVERGQEMLVIRSMGVFKSPADVETVRVGYAHGVPVLLKDVATVLVGYAPRQGVVSRDADEDAVEGIVLMRKGENPSFVLEGLRDRVDELNQRLLPKGVKVHAFYDRTELVDTTMETVFHNLLEGAGLVILVLLIFMMSLKAAMIVAVVIPLSLYASFFYLSSRGMSANLLSMGAVDFGIIVDGAVILVEHLFHRVHHPLSPDEGALSLEQRILNAAREVARPTVFSLLIIIAAYVPIFSLQRVEGRIFSPMANTVVSALVGAMLMTFTLVPVLCLFALRRARPLKESPLLRWAQRAYLPSLRFALARPLLVFTLATGLLAAGLALTPRLGSEFLPELNEGALYVTFTLHGNTGLTVSRRLVPQIKALLRRTPEVTGLLSQLGRPEDGTDAKLANNLEVFVRLKPLEAWRPGMTLPDLVMEMDHNLQELMGLEYNFSQPIRDNVNENISGQQGQVALKFYGEDLDQLQQMAEHARDALGSVPGIADLAIVRAGRMPAITVEIDRLALARYNLDVADVQDYIETAMAGHVASELWEGEKRFDLVVRLPAATREDVESIRRIMLPLDNGTLVPLSAMASVETTMSRAAVTRENGRRYIGLRMNIRNRDLGSFMDEARAKVAAAVSLPPGYQAAWGGEFENKERAMKRLQVVIPLALLITFLLLFSAFGNLGDSALVMLNVPFGLVGGVAGLAWAGMPLSVSAAVGFIALLGQSVLNGVLVVTAIRTRLNAGQALLQAVVSGAAERLRAILMTALLASLGLVPAAFSHAIGSETQRPIAVVVVAGTISAAALTLIMLPVSFYWLSLLWSRRTRWQQGGAMAEAH